MKNEETEETITVEIDNNTGMPLVPPGTFWRVRMTTNTNLKVELHRRKPFGGSDILAESYAYGNFIPESVGWEEVTPEDVRQTAVELWRSHMRDELRRTRMRAMSGDYPPKRLA